MDDWIENEDGALDIEDAAIVWTPADDRGWPGRPAGPRVAVLPYAERHSAKALSYAMWTPAGTGDCLSGPHPDRIARDERERRLLRRLLLFVDFHTLVVRDGIPPAAAHRAFLRIAEYRRHISPDMPGAED